MRTWSRSPSPTHADQVLLGESVCVCVCVCEVIRDFLDLTYIYLKAEKQRELSNWIPHLRLTTYNSQIWHGALSRLVNVVMLVVIIT